MSQRRTIDETADRSPADPSGSWIWLLALFTLASFVEGAFYSQINAFTPLYLPKLGVPQDQVAAWTGAVVAITSAIGLPLLPFWGALADRYARQPIIVRSFVAHFLAGLGMVLSGSIWVFLLARSITSFALGNSGLMMTTLSERSPRLRQGLTFSIMNSGAPVGVFVGPLIGGALFDAYGFRTLVAVNVVVMGLVILGMAFGYKDRFVGTDRGPLLSMAADSVRIVLRTPRLRILFPALFALFAAWLLALTYIPLVTTSIYTGSETGKIVGLVIGAGGLTALIGSPILGALADRWGQWRVLIAAGLVGIVLWPLPALAHNLWSLAVTWALISAVSSSVFAISFSVLASSTSDDVRGRVMSFAYLPVNLGLLIGPAIGAVLTRFSLLAVFPTAAVFTALGVVGLWLARNQPIEVSGAAGAPNGAPDQVKS
ncbi:MAG: MFS transporter [Anaerolineales bacterium]